MSGDPFDLTRFVLAQNAVFETAILELAAGRKTTHWMWFVFPQLRGLGRSQAAWFYGLSGLEEARAYLAHPLLSSRLETAVAAAGASPATSLRQLFGSPDDMKFCSSMTLFMVAAPAGRFGGAIERWSDGKRDHRTLARLGRTGAGG